MTMILSRREMLSSAACGFGSLALSAMCGDLATAGAGASPLAAKAPHFAARAKRVIFLFMAGGPSQVDMFDFKLRLAQGNGQPLPFSLPDAEATVGLANTRLLGPITRFSHQGESGLYMTDLWPEMARHADELCVLRAVESDSLNHPLATNLLHTGSLNARVPSMGAWISYGLGTENQQLPSYLTIIPAEGEGNYGSAFLPAIHQGTPIQEVGINPNVAPIRNLSDPSVPPKLQRRRIDLIQEMNRRKLARLKEDQQMEGVIESFELAFRMQTETPKLVDLSGESQAVKEMYGIGVAPTDQFGRQCLLARRFAEAGVRFVQVSLGGWDHHAGIKSALPNQLRISDKPIAGLISDLKSRGLLEDTLVIWSGEFGRTPFSQDNSGSGDLGRDHNDKGFTVWMAGGGVRQGYVHGATDEFGFRAVDGKVHIHDLHATILHLLGIDHLRLTHRYIGRDFRLTDVYGRVVKDILS
ncbi:MAG: DUF1501 domain-containing protein [Pirellulales bacterium]